MEWVGQSHGMRIIDCFPFFNELELLRLRIEELRGVVSHHVLVEAAHSHRGAAKPRYFREHRGGLAGIEQVVAHEVDLARVETADPWVRERAQRNAILDALAKLGCDDDDIILLSDADEIPRASVMPVVRRMVEREGVALLELTLHRFFLNNVTVAADNRGGWCGPVAITYADLRKTTPSALRAEWCAGGQLAKFASAKQARRIVRDAGWHFTYMGGREAVVYKRQNFAHVEGDDPGLDRVGRWGGDGFPLVRVRRGPCRVYGDACPCGCIWRGLPQAYDESPAGLSLQGQDLPQYLLKHRDQFSAWIRTAGDDPVVEPIAPAVTAAEAAVLVLVRDAEDLDALKRALAGRSARFDPWWICDIRAERQVVPAWVETLDGVNWFRWPSRPPGRALNALLGACRATRIERWRRDWSCPKLVALGADLLSSGGYDESVPVGHDWVLWWRGGSERAHPGRATSGIRWLERESRRSLAWEAQLHVIRMRLRGEAAVGGARRGGWASRGVLLLWSAKERLLGGQLRTAGREFRNDFLRCRDHLRSPGANTLGSPGEEEV